MKTSADRGHNSWKVLYIIISQGFMISFMSWEQAVVMFYLNFWNALPQNRNVCVNLYVYHVAEHLVSWFFFPYFGLGWIFHCKSEFGSSLIKYGLNNSPRSFTIWVQSIPYNDQALVQCNTQTWVWWACILSHFLFMSRCRRTHIACILVYSICHSYSTVIKRWYQMLVL